MNKWKARLLMALAGDKSVVLNTTINVYKREDNEEIVGIVYQGETYQAKRYGSPAIEITEGALVAGCTFKHILGKADRFVNA